MSPDVQHGNGQLLDQRAALASHPNKLPGKRFERNDLHAAGRRLRFALDSASILEVPEDGQTWR